MAMMLEKLDAAIADAVAAGVLDERKHGVLIEGARVCAGTIDAAEVPTAALLTALLNYCRALGIVPTNAEIDRRRRPQEQTAPSRLEEARSRRFMVEMREKFANSGQSSQSST